MLLTHPPEIDSIEAPARRRDSFMLAARSGLYILLVLAVTLAPAHTASENTAYSVVSFWLRFRRVSRLLRRHELW